MFTILNISFCEMCLDCVKMPVLLKYVWYIIFVLWGTAYLTISIKRGFCRIGDENCLEGRLDMGGKRHSNQAT